MKQDKYYITEEQLEDIKHYKRMFEYNAELVEGLCNSEKDEIVYGFELGRVYTHLRDCFGKMMDLEDDIEKQIIE